MHNTSNGLTVQQLRWVSESAFVLRFDRGGVDYAPGQYLSVGPADDIHMREYSVYSSPNDPFLEILVKMVDGGLVSNRLKTATLGDPIAVDGPFGFFTIDEDWRTQRYVFLATGTGISPFHSFVSSYPGIDYTLLHGIRSTDEAYEDQAYDRSRYVRCISRDDSGDYKGRVTDYIREHTPDPNARYYLCGNCDMIYEAFDILQESGVPHNHLFAEVYF